MATVYFKEIQYLRKTQFMLVVVLLTLAVACVFVIQLLQFTSIIEPFFTDKTGLIIFRVSEMLFAFLFYILITAYLIRLDTEISDKGVKFRMYPFMKKYQQINKTNIKGTELINSSKIKGYNSWSLRRAFGRKKGYFIISGSTGLKINLLNGEKFTLGTRKKQSIQHALKKLTEKENELRKDSI